MTSETWEVHNGDYTETLQLFESADPESVILQQSTLPEGHITPQKRETFRKREKTMSKQEKAKFALDRGLEHFNVKGKLIPAKSMRTGCPPNCRFKCQEKITLEQRTQIFKGYYKLGDKTRQNDYIRDCITVTEPKIHTSAENHKNRTIKYSFKMVGAPTISVCKKMFLDTLGISERPVRTILKKLEKAKKEGGATYYSPDGRGKHAKVNPAVQKKNQDNIMEHIKLFKPVPSHFCRARSKRVYLPRYLTIRKMWKMYKEWMVKEKPGQQIKSEKYYRKIFCTRFNIGFHKPKKDLCEMCTVYNLSSTAQKKKMQDKYDTHIGHKQKAKIRRAADKVYASNNKDKVCYVIFDLQKVLLCPKCETSCVYYLRKLSVYNFTIYDVLRKQGYCYIWDETEAMKGANEIATSLLMFIIYKVTVDGVTEFLFWSDNCSGQNKNKYLFAMYSWACAKLNIKITHRYMETGHTMNECDSVHARIEKAARYEDCFVPMDWVEIIIKAKETGNQYEVNLMGKEVLDFHPLADEYQSWKKKGAKWKQVREIVVDSKNPGKVFLKHDFAAPNAKEISINKVGRPLNLADFKLNKAFSAPIALKKKKLANLAKMCNELVIPTTKHDFFKNLVNFPVEALKNPALLADEEDDESEEEEIPNFLFDSDESEAETDYEEELEILKAAQSKSKQAGDDNPDNEKNSSDDEDGKTDSEAGDSDISSQVPDSDG